MQNTFDPPRRRRWRRWLIGVFSFLAVTATLFYFLENWRADRGWQQEQDRLRAQGESLIFTDYLPQPVEVPDSANAATATLFTARLNASTKDSVPTFNLEDVLPLAKSETLGNPATGKALPLERIQSAFAGSVRFPRPAMPGTPAHDVLHALSLFEKDFSELRAIADSSHARFAFRWQSGLSVDAPHLSLAMELNRLLLFKATAEVAAGQEAEALQDVLLMLRLAEWTRMPYLLALLVEDVIVLQAIHAAWHGLAKEVWTEPQLQKLDEALSRLDIAAQTLTALRGERALATITAMHFQEDRGRMLDFYHQLHATDAQLRLIRLMPRGWVLQMHLYGCRDFQRKLTGLQSGMPERGTFKVVPPLSIPGKTDRSIGALLSHLLDMGSPDVVQVVLQRTREVAAYVALARTAIGVELYRMANGMLPVTLPPRMPVDPVTGLPLGYEGLDNGRYRLWSAGLNEHDDGGSSQPARRPQDWLWISWVAEGAPD